MSTLSNLTIAQADLAAFCQRWHVIELALFGSVLRADFTADSDIDVLVTFEDGIRVSFVDLFHMQDALKVLFGREVDLGIRSAVETDPNYIRRKHILSSLQVIYAA